MWCVRGRWRDQLLPRTPHHPIPPNHGSHVSGDCRATGRRLSVEVKRTAYIVLRQESGNGEHGFNNNYVGAQADSGRWPEYLTPLFDGVVDQDENGTQRERLFLSFASETGCLTFLCDRMQSRGIYIGGVTHQVTHVPVNTESDLVVAYYQEWVMGSAAAEPSQSTVDAFRSMYGQAAALFRVPAAPGADDSADALNAEQIARDGV